MQQQQQQQQGEGNKRDGWTPVAASPLTVPQKALKVFPDDTSIARSEAEVFYGLALLEGEAAVEGDVQKVFVDKTECLTALKKHRGSRFKAFRTYEEAVRFSEAGAAVAASQGATGEEGGASSQPVVNVEKPSPFRGPKSQDLVKFRKSIERGDFVYFCHCIEENPRYLVSSGDTPAVLQEGFRYNALHVACRTNQPAFVEKVLATVSCPEFFQRLYPDDSFESAGRRSAFLLDLYLNTPDKGFNETPLHFASKHGSLQCVRVLVLYPGCDVSRPNKFGQTAAEIAGSRMKEPQSRTIEDIQKSMREQYYVPVLRDDDLCLLPRVGTPWSPQLDSPTGSGSPNDWVFTSSPLSVMSSSPISPSLKVRGVAGPMSCTQAEAFHRLWRTNSSTDGTSTPSTSPSPAHRFRSVRAASLRITDHEKGLERAGRVLAEEQGVGWREYWAFLGKFVNLASEEGLAALETHLRNKTQQLRREREELDATDLADRLIEAQRSGEEVLSPDTPQRQGVGGVSWVSQASASPVEQLCRELEALRLNTSLSPQADITPAACSKFLSFLQQQQPPPGSECAASPGWGTPQESGRLAEQVSYVLRSVEVSAGRVGEALHEMALDLQASIAASLGMDRALRAKLRSEVACLRGVVARAGAILRPAGLDLGFVHPLLAGRAVMALWRGAAPADLAIVGQALRVTVSHMDLVPLDSSDEESGGGGGGRHFEAPRPSRREDRQHLGCVLRCLDAVLQADTTTTEGITSPQMPGLAQCCCCPWHTDASTEVTGHTAAEATSSERDRVTSVLQQALRGSRRDPVVRHLTFTPGAGEEEDLPVVGAGGSLTMDTSGGAGQQEEEEPGCRSPDSFVSAASSLEGDMCTPEEGLPVFIGGAEATKTDVDVLEAVGDRLVDEHKYPHVFQWQVLVKSFSSEQQGSWASPFCRHGRRLHTTPGRGSNIGSAPSKLSLQQTPHRPLHARPPASTPRVLFHPF